ncbi:MAG: hypothetical protein A6F71_10400 [Cycloclasticus sp. symbiont of Poecilosclerida sp. M]|nr:MAG: hypothetical protein A6F71_10400 [Cycloclasticus sp. symbiont of Poecilosclerida sp. M]
MCNLDYQQCLLNYTIFLSHALAPNVAPPSFMASEITSREFRLSWAAPAPIDANGILRHYVLDVSEQESEQPLLLLLKEVQIEAVLNETDFLVEDLTPYTVYNCSVVAITIERGPTAVIQVRTEEEGEGGIIYEECLAKWNLSIMVTV